MLDLRRSLFITFFSTNAATVVQFGVTLVIARLLTPAEVGIFSITVVFINIIAVFRDFGVSSYLQQEKDLTPEKARAAFGLLLSSSLFLAVATYLGRNYIADFYGEPGIASVLAVLCISYAIVPYASYFFALLARNLEAGKQAVVNGVGTLAYAGSCLTLAFLGYSYMAMAWANVINIAATIVTYLIIRPKDTPCWPSFRGWKEPARFGGGAIIGNLLEKIHLSIPDLVLGKVSGAHDVGLYSRANGLVGIFAQIAGPTISYNAVPFIARSHHARQPLPPLLATSITYLTGLAWPAFIVTAVFAEEIIRVLYGAQWIAAAPIAVLIAIQALVRFGYSLAQPALMAIGRPYLSAISTGASTVVRFAILFYLQAQDLMTFAIALCIADVLTTIIPAWLMARYLGFPIADSLRAHWPSVKLGSVCLLVALGLRYALPGNWHDILRLSIVGIVVPASWIFCVIRFRHPLRKELPSMLNKLLPPSLARPLIDRLASDK